VESGTIEKLQLGRHTHSKRHWGRRINKEKEVREREIERERERERKRERERQHRWIIS
jgi:hypothetical protein